MAQGYIFAHGTGQDSTSVDETTRILAMCARANGHRVVEIGGPGSTERAILTDELNFPNRSDLPIWEMGFPTDYGVNLFTGTAFGDQTSTIAKEIADAVYQMRKEGITELYLVGFSRGAVAIALALQQIDMEGRASDLISGGTYTVVLLDPVPGPFRVPKTVTIPDFVTDLHLFVSKHEGRLGFAPLQIKLGGKTKFKGDLVVGVHGDIGGSTRRPMPKLVRSAVSKIIHLPEHRLSSFSEAQIAFEIMLDSSPYLNPSLPYRLSRRKFESPIVSPEDPLEELHVPTSSSLDVLQSYKPFKFLTSNFVQPEPIPFFSRTEVLERYRLLIEARKKKPLRLKVPSRLQVASKTGHVYVPPSTTKILPKFLEWVKKLK